jgi:tRNA threonylcarbamoyladenosine biosynthesis protein TsaB
MTWSVALESSCPVGAVALGRDGEVVASERLAAGMNHARDMVPVLGRLAAGEKVDLRRLGLVILDLGPGSFTGVRVGVAVAKAIYLATRCPVVGVLATDAVAAQVGERHPEVCVVIDATRGELYTARYRLSEQPGDPARSRFSGAAGAWERFFGPAITRPADLLPTLQPGCYVTGGGLSRYGAVFRTGGFPLAPEADRLPAVEWVHALGWERYRSGLTDDPYGLEPMYLRLPAAEERWRERAGRA